MSAMRNVHGSRWAGGRIALALLVVVALVSTVGPGNAVDTNLVRGVCVAQGPLRVIAGNQVRFSAQGFCGPLKVQINDFLGPFQFTYPTWTGGCGYGPPLPRLRLAIVQTDPTNTLVGYRPTFWYFPTLVIGDDRFRAPNWLSRLYIRDIVDDPFGRPTAAGATVGHGAMLAKVVGDCNFRQPGGAKVLVTFVLTGDLDTQI
ncbi:MAG TPA: hypothetical protein VJ979_11840 [Actinomycetota bacterium]|nr:hypothetical protein [Actinomycetota bacterium]